MAERNKTTAFASGLPWKRMALRLGLGICPAAAATTTAANGLAMGLATACVLVCASFLAALLFRGRLSDKGRLPVLLVICAALTTVVQSVLRLCLPGINAALGIYVPLIAVSSVLLCRLDIFEADTMPGAALADGLGMGLGYVCALTLIGAVRELIGIGSVFGTRLLPAGYEPMLLAILPAGGLMAMGILLGIANAIAAKRGGDGGEEARS